MNCFEKMSFFFVSKNARLVSTKKMSVSLRKLQTARDDGDHVAQIRQAYGMMLQREPDQEGFEHYSRKLTSGEMNIFEIMHDMNTSEEAESKRQQERSQRFCSFSNTT
jgi:hypothetical protein